MKKIPLLFLSILTTGLIFGPSKPTYAAILENNTTWWTVEELLDFYPEVEAEKEVECGDNLDCRMEFGFSMIERGEKYGALSNLLNSQFRITSINPETNTIKVLFFDDDMMLKRMGIEEKLELENLYIGWTEPWVGHGYYHNFEAPFDSTMSGIHQLFNSESENVELVTPWQESEFPMLDSDISSNTNGVLYFTIYAKDNMFNAQGSTNYSSCLNSPDYKEGMECKLYISGNRGTSYFPPREQIVEQEPIITLTGTAKPTEPEDPIEPVKEPTEPSEPEEEAESAGQTNIIETKTPLSAENQGIIGVNTTPLLVKAPETGRIVADPNNSIEMPWWMILINITGVALIVWWFIPTKSQKSRKKFKKTLDKKGTLR